MANTSIYNAFERLWTHVVNALSGKANQTDLDSLSSEFNSHTHNYAGSSSAGGSANSAVKWSTARIINGMSVDGSTNRVNYGECSTDAATTAKTVSCTGFSLVTGAEITVKFTVSNTASNPTLNVNSTGAKPIYYRGSAITTSYLAANRTYTFRYDGTSWNLVGDINVDTNTDTKVTQTATTTSADYRVLFSGTADDTSRAETARKSSNLKFNPSTGTLTATTFSGALDSSNLSSAVPVSKGGTGATTFASGTALIGNGTGAIATRNITNNTALTYIAYNANLMTTNTLAFWNGSYNAGGASNLTYCVKGAFGSIVTKNTGDYLASTGGTITGNLTAPAIELSNSAPYIDFHFNKSSADYTSRIIESSSGVIKVNCAAIGTEAVTISQSNKTRAFFKVANSTCAASFVAASDGYFGINNSNNSSWVICATNDGTIYLGDAYKLTIPTATSVGIRPNVTNTCSLGHGSYLWTTVYAKTTSISASDRNQKKEFRTFDSNENYEKFFMDLKPTIYKFKENESNRDHFGFISQDVEESLYKHGFNDKSFAGFCKDVYVDEDDNPILDENGEKQWNYALRYEEFISLNTYMIQKSYSEIDAVRTENEDLKARIEKLEKIIEELCA